MTKEKINLSKNAIVYKMYESEKTIKNGLNLSRTFWHFCVRATDPVDKYFFHSNVFFSNSSTHLYS